MAPTFKHILAIALLFPALAHGQAIDLLADGADGWEDFDEARWQFVDGELRGSTAIFDGDKTDPEASTFLVSKQSLSDNYVVVIEVTFERGRYLGVYLDFGQASQTGMWLATGHELPDDAPDNEVERGYIKTVEEGIWIVRATGELVIERESRSLWNDGKLIAVYRREGGFPPSPLQIRLTNSAVRIHSLQVRTGRNRQ